MPTAKTKSKIPLQLPNLRWDAHTHTLWLDTVLVKKFDVRAPLQEFILMLFQNGNWPPIITVKHLPGESDRPHQDRIHDLVFGLNHDQKAANIFFFRNGQGNEIGWELTPTHKKGPRKKSIPPAE